MLRINKKEYRMMKRVWLRIMVLVLVTGFVCGITPQSVLAQSDDPALRQSFEQLNATPAIRNPAFRDNGYIFSTRVLDNNRQLVGYVRDVYFDGSGNIAYLDAEITRGGGAVPRRLYAADTVKFLGNVSAWEVPLEQYNNAVDKTALYSIQGMLGAEVKDIGGGWVGKVKHVLMDENASMLKALVLNEVSGTRRYTDLALPFDPAFIVLMKRFDRVDIRVQRAEAQSFRDFAKKKR